MTTKTAGMMYILEVGKEGRRSDGRGD